MKETILLTDGYKINHHKMYPVGIEMVYSNFTPRGNKFFPEAKEGSVVFGLQYFIKEYLIKQFNENFFNRPRQEVLDEYVNRVKNFTGDTDCEHIAELYDLGYLPIEIKALPEGSVCPIRVPMLTIKNTHPDFAWLTNYLESLMSNVLWMPCTSATGARIAKKQLKAHAVKTGFPAEVNLGFAMHDFSMRGMNSVESAIVSGMAHMTSFCGTETIPAIRAVEEYYGADASKELVAATVPATEHSIECSNAIFDVDENGNTVVDETDYFRRLITEVYPNGFISIVSDGFDFWNVIENILPKLKNEIMTRDGRVIIRPDSGNPTDIICGLRTNSQYHTKVTEENGETKYWCNYNPFDDDSHYIEVSEGQYYGAYYMLGKIFGWQETTKGYQYPDNHVGMIYGDAITLERQRHIYERLEGAHMAACNLVLARGSFEYQFKSRDSLSFAVKCTAVRINGELKPIFKKPKTDDGTKNSLKGLIWVTQEDGQYVAHDEATEIQEAFGCLETVFKDGKLLKDYTLAEIRERIDNGL